MKYLENQRRYLQTVNSVCLIFVGSFISEQLANWVNFPFNIYCNSHYFLSIKTVNAYLLKENERERKEKKGKNSNSPLSVKSQEESGFALKLKPHQVLFSLLLLLLFCMKINAIFYSLLQLMLTCSFSKIHYITIRYVKPTMYSN